MKRILLSLLLAVITATAYSQSDCGDNVTFTYRGSEVTYGTISKTYNEGESDEYTLCWLDRNLGADPMPFVPATDATGNTDTRLYGDLLQWGRFAEGHQVRANTHQYSDPASTSVPNDGNDWDGKFITTSSSPYDWFSTQDANLWQGGAADNNPCPPGWRVPTEPEWEAELDSWNRDDDTGAFDSPLKLPVAGGRNDSNGSLSSVDSSGLYWSSTVVGPDSRALSFSSAGAFMHYYFRAYGFSVRCLKD